MAHRLLAEREIRSTLALLYRVCTKLPQQSQLKTKEDLDSFHSRFGDLMFEEDNSDDTMAAMTKLLTQTKSKFFMLKVNHPNIFKEVEEKFEADTPKEEHNPFEKAMPKRPIV